MNGEAVAIPQPPLVPRRKRDRRAGLFELIRDLASDWVAQPLRPDLSTLLTGRLRQLLPARSVCINELPGGPSIRVGQPIRARDYVAYAIPVADPKRQVVLEASFPGERGVDDWTCQLLEATASLATMLFEAERRPCPRPAGAAASRRGGAARGVEPRHAGAARTGRAGRDDRFHRADRRRERNRQGTRRAPNPRVEPAVATAPSLRSTAPRWSRR